MRRKNYFALGVVMLALLVAVPAYAQGVTPSLLNYQGLLTDSNGDPINAQGLVVTFRIWDDPTSTDPFSLRWEETLTIDVTDGLFNVILGETVPITEDVFSTSQSYLGLTIQGEPESSPRTRLVSVGYSTRVETVDGARGGVISGTIGLVDGATKSGAAEDLRYELLDENNIVKFYANAEEVYTPCLLFSGDLSRQCTAAINSGAAQAEDPQTRVVVADNLTEILSETIDCPADGYVMALASFEADVQQTGGVNSTLRAGVSDLPGALASDQSKRWTVPGNTANSMNRNVISVAKIFAVTSGPHAFYLLGQRTEGDDDFSASKSTLSLVYIPKAYGLVSGAEASQSASTSTANARKIGDSAVATVAAKSATATELERQAREIATLKEQLTEIKALLQARDLGSR